MVINNKSTIHNMQSVKKQDLKVKKDENSAVKDGFAGPSDADSLKDELKQMNLIRKDAAKRAFLTGMGEGLAMDLLMVGMPVFGGVALGGSWGGAAGAVIGGVVGGLAVPLLLGTTGAIDHYNHPEKAGDPILF